MSTNSFHPERKITQVQLKGAEKLPYCDIIMELESLKKRLLHSLQTLGDVLSRQKRNLKRPSPGRQINDQQDKITKPDSFVVQFPPASD